MCFLAGGEPTVNVRGRGLGGRAQELAVEMAIRLDGLPRPALFISAGTDGQDGPTTAAGGLVDNTTMQRAAALGLDARAYLSDSNSHAFLSAVGGLVTTGLTGTNVMDIMALALE